MSEPDASTDEAAIAVVAHHTKDIRQGDHLDINKVPLSSNGEADWLATPDGLVVISQTCDIVRPDPPHLLVTPLVRLTGSDASEARGGKRPRYVAVPELGSDAFADLSVIASLDKQDPDVAKFTRGLKTDEQIRFFGRAVGRRFARFPFPDEVVPWFQPLQKLVRSRYQKEGNPEGDAFARVAELRVEAMDGWTAPPYDLTLVVILEPGELPVFAGDEMPDIPRELETWLRPSGTLRPGIEIADRLLKENDATSRYFLWLGLAESWANRCRPATAALARLEPVDREKVLAAVAGDAVGVEVLTADEFGLDRYRRSEELDLEHLSPPPPR
ncbi:hypothetical protein [Micromonospora chersina]|uniref:hypothetical protein n=1 Tax=Micromonospora chersina TaxID=47854 RepID=UPI0033ECBEDB